MDAAIRIEPWSQPFDGSIQPPGSKSITNRALICAAWANGHSHLKGVLDSEDTQVMVNSLQALGVDIHHDTAANTADVEGVGGQPSVESADLFVANSGTTIRFLTSILATARIQARLDGIERMRQRPIADLLDALNALGASARAENGNGCPPVSIESAGLMGGVATIRGNISSQYLSGLLMASPYAKAQVELQVEGELVSKPYVDMTCQVMESFGVRVANENYQRFKIPPSPYVGTDYAIEPDASAASYFWGAAAVTRGRCLVEGLGPDALQGDVGFCDCLEQMGCQVNVSKEGIEVVGGSLQGREFDMNAISDTVQTLAVVALFAEGPTTIRNVAHIRHKETDRISDLARELRKLGAGVDEFEDGLKVTPKNELHGASIETYNDHRMAMSFALAGLRLSDVVILNPKCTEKTYPRFFEDLESCR